jgi:hypothetical protein
MDADDHWVRWHQAYEDPRSSLSLRLVAVQRRLREALNDAPPGPVRVISMCAGQGRDVVGVVANHDRRDAISARLVELDSEIAEHARTSAKVAGLVDVEVVEGDASSTSSYIGAIPAHVILVCGVFGNIRDADVRRTVLELPALCAPGATVIWTRHRRAPDLTPTIRAWFEEAGFEEIAFDLQEGTSFGVGTNRLVASPRRFRTNRRMFNFVGDGADAHL